MSLFVGLLIALAFLVAAVRPMSEAGRFRCMSDHRGDPDETVALQHQLKGLRDQVTCLKGARSEELLIVGGHG